MSYTLLLADDSLTIRRVIELTFAEEDLAVTTVADGRRAMECIASLRPDIVLADVGMRPPGGYEIAAFVKGHAELSHIPVILLTAAFQPIDEARARGTGCDAVLEKPFELARLVARVKELLPSREVGAPEARVLEGDAPAAASGAQEGPGDTTTAAQETEPAPPDVPECTDASAGPSLDDRFDSIDAGGHSPEPLTPGSTWTSDADGRPMSLDDLFDLVDASTGRAPRDSAASPAPAREDAAEATAATGVPDAPSDASVPALPDAASGASGTAADDRRTAGNRDGASDADGPLPDVVTRTFLSLLDTAVVPSPPDLVERAVRLLLAGGSGAGQ